MINKVLVTGGAGFIGSWLCKHLNDNNQHTIVLDDLSFGKKSNLKILSDYTFIEGSILDEPLLDEVPWDQITQVYHLAALGDVHDSLDNPKKYMNVNVTGTHNILEKCREFNIPFLMTSTCMVYGLHAQYEEATINGIAEHHNTLPVSPYGASKLSAEQLAISYHYGYGCSIKIARPFNTYGPHQATNNKEGGVIPIFLQKALNNKDLMIFGDGTQNRDFLYVKDCANFLYKFMNSQNAPLILNAGTGKTISILDLAKKIVTSSSSSIHMQDHPHPQSEIMVLKCNSDLAKSTLNWESQYTLDQGLAENKQWISEQQND
ncbi:MAG: NAD-dependent epimerase/dehydratase family protein [Candidatus Cloacimonetes bacterium]|nr:NAD-dependent epimerase/dehydratase family protein [Candidatus Cloacimonadota bacterium]